MIVCKVGVSLKLLLSSFKVSVSLKISRLQKYENAHLKLLLSSFRLLERGAWHSSQGRAIVAFAGNPKRLPGAGALGFRWGKGVREVHLLSLLRRNPDAALSYLSQELTFLFFGFAGAWFSLS